MRSTKLMMLLATTLLSTTSHAGYEAHEWGTFTSVVGSDGITQNGMYHEDEPLPDFVHGFGELRKDKPQPKPCHSKICFGDDDIENNIITQKMETPVIYFYNDGLYRQHVDVEVRFPQGVITETYPGPVETFPTLLDPRIIANGRSLFSIDVSGSKSGNVPRSPEGNIYGHARAVNSNIVTSGAETEKFIFYRGLGRFQPKISITSKQGSLKISNLNASRPLAAVLVHVDKNGHGQMVNVHSISDSASVETSVDTKTILALKNHDQSSDKPDTILSGEQARGKLIDELVASGLFKDEAVAMVNTWENGYLKVPGLRLLYILPKTEVDEILPINFSPAPTNLIRSFVARMEILLDTEEQGILYSIRVEQDRFDVKTLGRFAEPILRRIRQVAAKTENEGSALLNLIDRLVNEVSGTEPLGTTTIAK